MMKSILSLLFILPLVISAQTKDHDAPKGIRFEHGLSWAQVQEKAKAEGKYVFVDAFTTWCGPCKYMSANIFTQEEVGNFFNANFVNVKAQLDKTEKDDEAVKSWYKDAEYISGTYNVQAFPTFLFFDPQGNLVHRFLGSSEAKEFITRATDALKPETQYYTLVNKFKNGEKDPVFLRNLAKSALFAYDEKVGKEAFDAYLATQTDLYTKENIELVDMFTSTTADKGFKMMLENPARYDAALGKPGAAAQKINEIVFFTEVMPMMRLVTKPDFAKLESNLSEKYPLYAKQITARAKVTYYQQKKEWNSYAAAASEFIDRYGKNMADGELNDYAWTVFEHVGDAKYLTEALKWSKRSFEKSNLGSYIDTYANILYRLGRKKEAIEWETKAIGLVSAEEKPGYMETLGKMKKGEKTWKD